MKMLQKTRQNRQRDVKSLVAFILRILARAVVRRYRPSVVMITGSVGKTSTKDAVATVLAEKFFVRKSEKSFNSELGVPFTIFGAENPWLNFFAWAKVLKSAFALIFLPNHYPNMLVLETGADCPGDLARILKIATPDMVVVTRLPDISVHVEEYASPKAVQEEEFSPAYALSAEAPLIVSADDPYAMMHAKRTSARLISYGFASEAMVRIIGVDFLEQGGDVAGMQAEIQVGDKNRKLAVRGSVGKTQVLPLAAAVAAGLAFDIQLDDAFMALEAYEPPPGRGRLFAGEDGSVIIDDSYNSSPAAVEEALATLKSFPHAKRRVAILGDMLELGRYSVTEHERIAVLANDAADVVISVGIRARAFTAGRDNADELSFNNSRDAAQVLPGLIQKGDVVLIKGSQSIRMERVVEALLADSADARLLVRQEKKWLEKM